MSIEGIKIYGLCLDRLKHQINLAKSKLSKEDIHKTRKFVLECYNTGDLEDIIDILELYDVEHKTFESVKEKLDELAYTVSVIIQEKVEFEFSPDGNLCLCFIYSSHK